MPLPYTPGTATTSAPFSQRQPGSKRPRKIGWYFIDSKRLSALADQPLTMLWYDGTFWRWSRLSGDPVAFGLDDDDVWWGFVDPVEEAEAECDRAIERRRMPAATNKGASRPAYT